MRILCFLLTFLISGSVLQAQSAAFPSYQLARQSTVILKNADRQLPLDGLDTLRIGVVSLSGDPIPAFLETMAKYTPNVSQTATVVRMGSSSAKDWAQEQANAFDVFVVIVRDETYRGRPLPYMYKRASIEALTERMPVISVVFDPQQGLEEMTAFGESKALIVAPYNEYGQSLAAQLLFGGSQADNRLTEALSTSFPAGSGQSLDHVRLGYAPPEAVDMDSQLLRDSIAAIVREGIDSMAYPGAQVLVARRGQVIYHQAFGHHTYEGDRPVKTTDIYDLASVTKVSSALAAIMRWYGEGSFDLDAPLTTYFDGFRRRSNKDELSYRQMLAHNARLRPWIPYWQGTLKGHGRYPWRNRWDPVRTNDYRFRRKTFAHEPAEEYTVRVTDSLWLHKEYKEKIYKAIRKSPLNEEPGYVYSGLLFYLLPEIVSDLAQTDYETHLKETFYQPLGAHTITYNPLRFFEKERIIPTERDTFFRMKLLHGTVHDEGAAMMDGVSSNAGLFASANDLAKLWQMYMNQGSYGGRQFIAAKAVEEFTRCQYCEEGNRRGLGFDRPLIEYEKDASSIAEAASEQSFGHSGYTGTFVWADPEEELLFIFFSNRVYPTRLNRKLYTLGIRPRLHTVLYEAMKDR